MVPGEGSVERAEVPEEERLREMGGTDEVLDDLGAVLIVGFFKADFEGLELWSTELESVSEGGLADAGVAACGAYSLPEVWHGISPCS
jgi:hypothetical protein